MKHRRGISAINFPERLEREANRLKACLKEKLPPNEREVLLRRLSQIETAAQIEEWLRSPGLQPPR